MIHWEKWCLTDNEIDAHVSYISKQCVTHFSSLEEYLFPLQLPSKATQFFSVILMLLHYQKASTRWSYQRVRLLPRTLIYFTCKMKCQFSLAPELFRIQNSAMEGNRSGIDPYSITQKPNVRLEIFHITEIQIGSSQTISTILKYNLGIHQHKHYPKMSTAKNTCARLLL